MNFRQLKAHLKTPKPRRLYYLYGSDPYLTYQSEKAIVSRFLKYPDMLMDFNVSTVTDTEISRALQDTSPDGSSYVVFVRGVGESKSRELVSWVNSPNPGCVAVFCAEEQPNRQNELFASFGKDSGVVNCEPPDAYQDSYRAMILSEISDRGLKFSDEQVNRLIEHYGNNCFGIAADLDKLVLFKDCSDFNDKFDKLLGVNRSYGVFDLANFVAHKALFLSFQAYDGLKAARTAVHSIFGAIEWQLRVVYKYLQNATVPPQRLAEILGVSPFYMPRIINQAQKWNTKKLSIVLSNLGIVSQLANRGYDQDVVFRIFLWSTVS